MLRFGSRLVFVAMLQAMASLGASKAFAAPVVTELKAQRHGIAVLAQGGSKDEAWPLAQAVYADPTLRPTLDEKRARVLVGEEVEEGELRDLAELRAGIKGDDAASRQLLESIADRIYVDALLVVQVDGTGHTTARTFSASSKAFDAAVFVAHREGDVVTWPGAVDSLHRQWAPAPSPVTPVNAKPRSVETIAGKPFYLSPWFWGAIGAAVIGGLAIVLATQDSSGDSIRLQLKVPK
jgi:hypothetical protein